MQQQLKMGVTGKLLKKANYDRVLSCLMFLYCAFLPFEEALASSLGSILKIFGVLIIGYAVLAYGKTKVPVVNIRLLFPFLAWIVLSVLSVAWSADFSWWWYFVRIYALQIVFVLVVCAYAHRIDQRYIHNGLIVGAVVAAAILILLPQESAFSEDGRRTIMILGREFDPNIVATIIMLGAFCCLSRVFAGQNERRLLYELVTVFLFAGMVFTGSRGALISFTVGFAVLILLELRSKETKQQAKLLLFLALIAVIAVWSYLPTDLLTRRFSFEALFGLNELEKGVHNRYTIWSYAVDLFLRSPFIGYGCGNFFSAIAAVYRQCASHNLYVLLLIEGGVVIASFFLYGLFRILRRLFKARQITLFTMLLSVCIMAMTLDTIIYKYFWVAIICSIISLRPWEEIKSK